MPFYRNFFRFLIFYAVIQELTPVCNSPQDISVKIHDKKGAVLLFFALILLILTTAGCASQMRGARLEQGELAIDLALSGPVAQMSGVYPIPFPSVGVRYGISERIQVGASYVPVLHVVRPVVILRLFEGDFAENPVIPTINLAVETGIRTDFSHFILYPRLDLAAIWHLEPVSPYLELGLFADSESLAAGNHPLVSVTMGANWRILPWVDMNAGLLYWGINKDYGYSTTSGDAAGTPWVLTPGGAGAIGVNLGFGIILGNKE